jgi:two-component system alkaline phosphatase synthesis response regulator PhoP
MASELILVVDDEPSILQLSRMYLERENFRVEAAVDGEAALEAIQRLNPALVVLDLMLPKLDGLEVCRRLRAADNPVAILMLTARDEDIDKILGLEIGADDYLTKPFNPHELVARIKAILRRSERADRAGPSIHIGSLEIDENRRETRIDDHAITLRTQEFELLLILAGQPGRVFTRQQLLEKGWGFDFIGQSRTVDVHISQLRKKLAGSGVTIETVTGIGYKLVS